MSGGLFVFEGGGIMSGEEVGLSDIHSQGAGVREKPIRIGYASGHYDTVKRGRMVTSVARVSTIQGRPDFASSSEG